MCHYSGQYVVDSRVSPQQILTNLMTRIIVNKSTDNVKPNSICFLPQYHLIKNFFSEREPKKAYRDMLTQALSGLL